MNILGASAGLSSGLLPGPAHVCSSQAEISEITWGNISCQGKISTTGGHPVHPSPCLLLASREGGACTSVVPRLNPCCRFVVSTFHTKCSWAVNLGIFDIFVWPEPATRLAVACHPNPQVPCADFLTTVDPMIYLTHPLECRPHDLFDTPLEPPRSAEIHSWGLPRCELFGIAQGAVTNPGPAENIRFGFFGRFPFGTGCCEDSAYRKRLMAHHMPSQELKYVSVI